jgi:hypothetical protein
MYTAPMQISAIQSRGWWVLAGAFLLCGCGPSEAEKQATAEAAAAASAAAVASAKADTECADGKKLLATAWGKYRQDLETALKMSFEVRASTVAAEQSLAELERIKKGDKTPQSEESKALVETTKAEVEAAKAALEAVKAAEKAASGPAGAARDASKAALDKATALRDMAPKVFDVLNAARLSMVKTSRGHAEKAKEYGGDTPEAQALLNQIKEKEDGIAKERVEFTKTADTLLASATAAHKQAETNATTCKNDAQ